MCIRDRADAVDSQATNASRNSGVDSGAGDPVSVAYNGPTATPAQQALSAGMGDSADITDTVDDLPTPENWPVFFDSLGLVGITHNIALHCELRAVSRRHLAFVLDENNATLFQAKQMRALASAFEQLIEQHVEVSIEVGQVSSATPAHHKAMLAAARQQDAETAMQDDPVLAALLQEFDGVIIEGSIRPL